MSKIKLSSIVAIAENHAIGKDNGMIWHLPEDLKHFKRTTMGKPIIMGRKSYESLGKPLPGRANIVISRSFDNLPEDAPTQIHTDMEAPDTQQAADKTALHYVRSIEDGIALGRKIAEQDNAEEIFITGGGEIYKQTLPNTERLYLTLIHKDYEGDTFFPEFDWAEWNIASEEKHEAEDDRPAFTFFTLERK